MILNGEVQGRVNWGSIVNLSRVIKGRIGDFPTREGGGGLRMSITCTDTGDRLVHFFVRVFEAGFFSGSVEVFLRNQLGSDCYGILLSLYVFSSQRSDPGFPRYKNQERREWSKT